MSNERKESSLLAYFGDLADPRIERCKRHQLIDIIAVGICAVICGADSFVEMEEFGTAKRAWFETFLDLPNGIPSHDTLDIIGIKRNQPDQANQASSLVDGK